MRKRRENGRFVRGPEVGAEKVTVEVGEAEAAGAKDLPAAPRPKGCRTYTRKRVAEALPEIVETFVTKAKQGSVPHARALAALGGLDKGDVVGKPAKRRGKSTGRRLLEKLGVAPDQF